MPPDAALAGAIAAVFGLSAIAALFGLLFGSFLNVCIHRWPRDLSVVQPRSMCPGCERPIAWYDNVPLLSYAMLRGRCRHCGVRISWRYPLVEALTAAAFFYFVRRGGGFTAEALKNCLFSAILIALVFSDLETLLLPDELTLGGLVAGLAISWFVPTPDAIPGGYFQSARVASFLAALAGAAVPAFALWAVGWLFEKLRHKQGLGFGDVKMIAMIGSFLGLRGSLLSLALGAVAGSVAGIVWILALRKDASSYPLPFGTFLGIAAFVAAATGPAITEWYAGLLGF
ncbi:MAG TPA: prepilin peptidase [Bryobacteraceae bacterium]|nr:prepilin peptidase [Bryobacteraceae bacterium]